MKAPILTSGDAYQRPWSVWADDTCLGRFAYEPSDARLALLAKDADSRGWIGTSLEVHRHGSWQRDYAVNFDHA